VDISQDVRIFTLEHDISSSTFESKGGQSESKIGFMLNGATILPAVTIGEGAVVAAGAVVTKDVKAVDNGWGIPAKFIKMP